MDLDPALFGIGFQDANKKLVFSTYFSPLFLIGGTLRVTAIFKEKRRRNTVERNHVVSYFYPF
jgi:hypothetical protein